MSTPSGAWERWTELPDPTNPWPTLRQRALQATNNSYAPYSRLDVGAAALCIDGSIVVGANVENASFGLTLCAECAMVTAAAGRKTSLLAVVCLSSTGRILTPCGRCRQLIFEHAHPACRVLVDADRSLSIGELLPHGFGPNDLPGDGQT